MAAGGAHVVLGRAQEFLGNGVSLPLWANGHTAEMADLIDDSGCDGADDLTDRNHGDVDGHVGHAVEHAFGS